MSAAPVWPDAKKLMAAAAGLTGAAADCIDAARDEPSLNADSVADGDTLVIALDAIRLLMEATGEGAEGLYPHVVRYLEQANPGKAVQ